MNMRAKKPFLQHRGDRSRDRAGYTGPNGRLRMPAHDHAVAIEHQNVASCLPRTRKLAANGRERNRKDPMSNRLLLILTIVVVAFAGAVYGFVQIDRTNFGIPRFYAWRMVGGQFHGSHRAQVNGISLYYETYGSGPPVLVLHGAAGFLETMHYFITALAPTHTVIAVDSRAQGRSTDTAAPLSYARWATT